MPTMYTLVVSSMTKDSPSAGKLTVVFDYTSADVDTVPSVQVTVPNYTDENPNWSRANRVNQSNFMVLRNGVTGVAIAMAGLNQMAYTISQSLTFAPVVLTQPANDTTNHSGGSAEFTADFGSELAATYQWQESADGTSWSNISNGGIYAGATTLTLTITPTDTTKNGYQYRCRATNSLGTTATNAATMTVT